MIHAGKEPAEDTKRAFVRAIELAGLKVHRVQTFTSQGMPGRFILGTANPAGWPHESPAIEMQMFVSFTGVTGQVEIRCIATDGEPLMNALSALILQHCSCNLGDLPETLQAVWNERRLVIDQGRQGRHNKGFVGRWIWKALEPPQIKR